MRCDIYKESARWEIVCSTGCDRVAHKDAEAALISAAAASQRLLSWASEAPTVPAENSVGHASTSMDPEFDECGLADPSGLR